MSSGVPAAPVAESAPVVRQPAQRRKPPSGWRQAARAMPWLGPAIVLIVAIVLFPVGYMIWTSTRDLSSFGVDRGGAGAANYSQLFAFGPLARVLFNTAIWVVGVVGVTVLISLGLAQFLSKAFPGRRLVRLTLIIPWAASVVMTSTVFVYALDPFYGVINGALVDLGILKAGYGFTHNTVPAFAIAMAVAVFVSLPFTTYTLLAGLQTIPEEVLEAAQMDGAGPWQRYRTIVLPLLRPAIAVASIINIINVFNSLPILQVLTGSLPGYSADTTTTLIFKFIRQERQLDTASALSVVNFLIVVAVIGIYLKVVKPMRED